MTTPAPPSNPVYPAGYAPVTADFNSLIQTPMQFTTGKIIFRVNQQTTQSVSSSGGYVTLKFDTVIEDPYAGWSSGSYEWVAPYDGLYEVSVFCSVATTAVNLQAGASLTGVPRMGNQVQTTSSLLGGACSWGVFAMIGGQDYIQGSVNTSVTFPTDVSSLGRYPRMEIAYAGRAF
jgi:hypothetical protein